MESDVPGWKILSYVGKMKAIVEQEAYVVKSLSSSYSRKYPITATQCPAYLRLASLLTD
jgi:hypothetical protein